MKKFTLLKSMLLLCALVAGSSSVWATDPVTLYLETFGSTSSNTALASYTGYSATAAMFTTTGNVNTHYSGQGSVGKNNLSAANLSSGYTGASGLSGCYHGGTAGTKKTIIQISNINIEGYGDLSLSFGALGGSTSHKVDVSYKIDGGSETALITNGSITNANWTLLTKGIAGTGKSLTLIFSHTPSKSWTIRMDDIKLTGIPVPSAPTDNGDGTITLETTANMDGWRAFYDATQDYTLDANTKAYVVTAKSGTEGEVVLTSVAATAIPHGEAVILKTSASNRQMVLTQTTGAATLGTNLLTVSDGTHNVDGYRLGYGSIGGSDAVGFFKYTTTTAPAAGIVYIDKNDVNTSTAAHGLSISFDDETTAIEAVKTQKVDGQYFNLAGQRVAQPTKGLYIVNGKKVVIK